MAKSKEEQAIQAAFSRKFSRLRRNKDAELSNIKLGKVFGVSDATISKWESGKAMPAIAHAIMIATHYNVAVEWLLTGRGPSAVTPEDDPLISALLMLPPDQREYFTKLIHSMSETDK